MWRVFLDRRAKTRNLGLDAAQGSGGDVISPQACAALEQCFARLELMSSSGLSFTYSGQLTPAGQHVRD